MSADLRGERVSGRCGSSKSRPGFTIIELMIVIAIVIIMSGISVPYLRAYISSQRLQEVAWQMVQDLRTVKEDAILYQQDLNVYINFDSSKTIALGTVQPFNPANKDNRSYLFETFQWGKDQTTQTDGDHYVPTDAVNQHFTERVLKYGVVIDSISSGSPITFNSKKYFVICFRSGAGSTFRGEGDMVTAMSPPPSPSTITDSRTSTTDGTNSSCTIIDNSKLVIKLEDSSTNKYFYLIVDGAGKISMYGSPPS